MRESARKRLEFGALLAAVIGCVTGVASLSWNICSHYGSAVERAVVTLSLVPVDITEKGLPVYEVKLEVTNVGAQDLYVRKVLLEPVGPLAHLPEMESGLAPGSYREFTFGRNDYLKLLTHWYNYSEDFYGRGEPRVYVVTSRGKRFPVQPTGIDYVLARLKTLSWVRDRKATADEFLKIERESVTSSLKPHNRTGGGASQDHRDVKVETDNKGR